MSNYFARLLERHSSAAVLPRARARFEPEAISEESIAALEPGEPEETTATRPPLMRSTVTSPLPRTPAATVAAPIAGAESPLSIVEPERAPDPAPLPASVSEVSEVSEHRSEIEPAADQPPFAPVLEEAIVERHPHAPSGEEPRWIELEPPAAPRTSRPTPRARADVPTSSAPIVRVTIGRLEVRAVAPPPEKPKRREKVEPQPMLTLEQYAGERNRGGGS